MRSAELDTENKIKLYIVHLFALLNSLKEAEENAKREGEARIQREAEKVNDSPTTRKLLFVAMNIRKLHCERLK